MSVEGRVAVVGGGEVVLWSGEHTDATAWEIKQWIAETAFEEFVAPSDLRLLHHFSEISDDTLPLRKYASSPFFKVLFRLHGGKGGFGSMLRAMGAKKSEHATDNIESCRTLTGRRIRHVNDEKKIAEWKAKEPERLAAVEKRKQERRERNMTAPKHNFDHHKLAVDLHENAQVVDAGVRAGFEASLEHTKRLLEGEAAVSPRQAKRPKFGWDDSDSDMSSDGESAAAGEAVADEVADGGAASASDPETPSAGGKSRRAAKSSATRSKQSDSKQKRPKKQVPDLLASDAPVMETEQPSVVSADDVTPVSEEKAATAVTATAAAPAPPRSTAPVVPEKLDLAQFESIAALESLGLDRLKAALMAEGLKCGGTLTERAERLLSVKGASPEDYPADLRAGSKKKKK